MESITGSNFTSGATVTFDRLAGTSISVGSDGTYIFVTTPAHSAGSVNVTVTNPDGQSITRTNGYSYSDAAPTITNISPQTGHINGGTRVYITGSNFTSGATVTFDGLAGTSISVGSDGTYIFVTTPAHSAGSVSVTVTNPDGQSITRTNGYSYSDAAACTYTISPTSKSYISSGGSQDVTVIATAETCEWTVSESLDWITVSSTSGTGSGSVTVTASQNTGAARIGIVTIAGQSFSVSQEGVSSDIVVTGPGWNLISLPVQPADTTIGNVLSGISGKYASVWGFQNGVWQVYDSTNPDFSDLSNMEAGWGYWLNMTEPATLSVTGATPSPSMNLITGWNLVGYNSSAAIAIADALSSITGNVLSVWAYMNDGWLVYDPANPDFSDLTEMTPGYGYWINTNGACTWTLP